MGEPYLLEHIFCVNLCYQWKKEAELQTMDLYRATITQSPTGADDPPGGVLIPATLISAAGLSAGALHTWAWLRGLAMGSCPTQAYSIQELSKLIGKSPSTLYNHLAILKSRGALRWQNTGKGTLSFVFDPAIGNENPSEETAMASLATGNTPERENDFQPCGNLEVNFQNSRNLEDEAQVSRIQESGNAASLNPEVLNILINQQDSRGEEGKFRDARIQEGEIPETGAAPCGEEPEAIYRALTGRRPNRAQRAELMQRVEDLGRWRGTLAHWQMHGWNPTNLAGMLDLYQRGGAAACRYCGKAEAGASGAAPGRMDPFDELLAEIKQKKTK